jgi:peptide subunit release factor 1 (eRF1)
MTTPANKINLKPRKCKGCGMTFTPTSGRQRYHSEECREEHAPYGRAKAAGKQIAEQNGAGAVVELIRRNCDQELEALTRRLERIQRQRERALNDFDRRIARIEADRDRVLRVTDALGVAG